ncbi:MAG: hypothetical protein ACRC7N_20750 [Clostridium sp.]
MSNELIGNLAMGGAILISLLVMNFTKKARSLDNEIKSSGGTVEEHNNLRKYKNITIFLMPIDIILVLIYFILV